jgi:hypothetical protein
MGLRDLLQRRRVAKRQTAPRRPQRTVSLRQPEVWVPRNRAERRSVRRDRVRANRAQMRADGKRLHAYRIPRSGNSRTLLVSQKEK